MASRARVPPATPKARRPLGNLGSSTAVTLRGRGAPARMGPDSIMTSPRARIPPAISTDPNPSSTPPSSPGEATPPLGRSSSGRGALPGRLPSPSKSSIPPSPGISRGDLVKWASGTPVGELAPQARPLSPRDLRIMSSPSMQRATGGNTPRAVMKASPKASAVSGGEGGNPLARGGGIPQHLAQAADEDGATPTAGSRRVGVRRSPSPRRQPSPTKSPKQTPRAMSTSPARARQSKSPSPERKATSPHPPEPTELPRKPPVPRFRRSPSPTRKATPEPAADLPLKPPVPRFRRSPSPTRQPSPESEPDAVMPSELPRKPPVPKFPRSKTPPRKAHSPKTLPRKPPVPRQSRSPSPKTPPNSRRSTSPGARATSPKPGKVSAMAKKLQRSPTNESYDSLRVMGSSPTHRTSASSTDPVILSTDKVLYVSGTRPTGKGRGVTVTTQTTFPDCRTLAEVRALRRPSLPSPKGAARTVGVAANEWGAFFEEGEGPGLERDTPGSPGSIPKPTTPAMAAAGVGPSDAAEVATTVAEKAAARAKRRAKKRAKAKAKVHVPRHTVFESHKELLQLLEFAASAQSFRSVMRVLKGIPARQWVNVPDEEGAALCLDTLAAIHEDLAKQAEADLELDSESSVYSFGELSEGLQDSFVCLADLWREKVALDRAFLTAVYRDRIHLLAAVNGEIEELVGSVSLQARETRRHYLLARQEDAYDEAELVAQSADHINAILDKTATCVRRARHRIQAAMRERYAERDAKYQDAKEIIEEEEDTLLQEVWNSAGDEHPQVRSCLTALENHVQLAYRNMQQRLLQEHLDVLNPMVEFASAQANVGVPAAGALPAAEADEPGSVSTFGLR